MKILINNIVLHNDTHKYYHEETGLVDSVSTIIKGTSNKDQNITTDSMEYGRYVHTLIENYFKDNLGVNLDSIHNCKEAKEILLAIDKLNVKPVFSEASFIAIDDNLKFGGTIDLVCEDRIVDYKTGKYYSHYDIQVSVYAHCMGKKLATIIYIEDGNVLVKTLTQNDILGHYKYFLSRLSAKYGGAYNLDSYTVDEITKLLTDYDTLKEQEKELRIKSESIKSALNTFLEKNNTGKYQINNYVITRQERETKNLKPNYKKELLTSHPEYFTFVKSNPFITINKVKDFNEN